MKAAFSGLNYIQIRSAKQEIVHSWKPLGTLRKLEDLVGQLNKTK